MDMLRGLIKKYLQNIDIRNSPLVYLGQVIAACVSDPCTSVVLWVSFGGCS